MKNNNGSRKLNILAIMAIFCTTSLYSLNSYTMEEIDLKNGFQFEELKVEEL